MAGRLNVPSVLSLNTEGMSQSTLVFMQTVEDSLKTLDRNVVYSDTVTVDIPTAPIKALSAQGQAFDLTGVSVASGADYATLVSDVRAILQGQLQLESAVKTLATQIKGTQ